MMISRLTHEDLTVYWLSGDADATPIPGPWYRESTDHISGTNAEAAEWHAAALACVKEVAAARQALPRGREHWWSRWRRNRARSDYRNHIRAAAAAYEPVRRAIEQRIEEANEARRAEARRQYLEQERRRAEDSARFEAWERRQAVADQPSLDGPTPRSLAERLDPPHLEPPRLDPASESLVGDVEVWWAGVRAGAVNARARAAAVRSVVDAINQTASALERAGRPGIAAITGRPSEVLRGWWIDFDWSGLSGAALERTPDVPVRHWFPGTWRFGVHKSTQIAFVPRDRDRYACVSETFENVANMFTRHRWWHKDVETFADFLFPGWISYTDAYSHVLRVRIPATDHLDPADYVPYVEGVAERVVETFANLRQRLIPDED